MTTQTALWKRGLPPGKCSPEMLETFETYPTVMGWVHRKRTEEEIIEYRRRLEEIDGKRI